MPPELTVHLKRASQCAAWLLVVWIVNVTGVAAQRLSRLPTEPHVGSLIHASLSCLPRVINRTFRKMIHIRWSCIDQLRPPREKPNIIIKSSIFRIFLRAHYMPHRPARICFIAQGYRLKNIRRSRGRSGFEERSNARLAGISTRVDQLTPACVISTIKSFLSHSLQDEVSENRPLSESHRPAR